MRSRHATENSSEADADRASMRDQDGTLHFTGRLQCDTVPMLWAGLPRPRIQRIDLSEVTALDTAGLALLVEIVATEKRAGGIPQVLHASAGYAALCAAYRIRTDLDMDSHAQTV